MPASLPARMLSPMTLARVPLLLLGVFSGIPLGLSDLQPIMPPLQPSVPEHHLVHRFSPVEKKQWNRMLLFIPGPHSAPDSAICKVAQISWLLKWFLEGQWDIERPRSREPGCA